MSSAGASTSMRRWTRTGYSLKRETDILCAAPGCATKPTEPRRSANLRNVMLVGLTMLGGCSLIVPHPLTTPDKGIEQCSLDTLQSRQNLPQTIAAQGVAVPVIVRKETSVRGDRLVRTGQAVYFIATHHHAGAPRNIDLGDNRRLLSMNSPQSRALASVWVVDAIGSGGTSRPADAIISDGALVRLRSSAGYLKMMHGKQDTTEMAEQASTFVVYKIDVPDSTRPTTCDAKLRDGDFIFLRSVAPSSWVDASDEGLLRVLNAPQPSASADSDTASGCAQEQERCHTDNNGALVCAWAPKCSP